MPERFARRPTRTWWSSKARRRMTTWSQSCQTDPSVHIIGLESLKTTRTIPGLGLGITARGLGSSLGPLMNPTTTTLQSSASRSTWTTDKTAGSGMMRNAPIKSSPSVSKVGKWFNPDRAQRCYGPIEYFLFTAQCNETSCVRGQCWETIENTMCLCEDGFQADKCEKGEDLPVFHHQSYLMVFNCDCVGSQMSHCVWC